MNDVTKRKKRRVIQGVKGRCVDGIWSDADDLPLPPVVLVAGMHRIVQCWKDGTCLDEYWDDDGPLPDIDDLNSQIPQAEWEVRFNKPQPPWGLFFVIYLVNPETADTYTFVNNTVGASIAYERLETKFNMMRRMRGNDVRPLVRLDSRPMKVAALGITKLRPEFIIVEWRDLGGHSEPQPAQLSRPNDKDPDGAAAKPPAEKPKATVGKPVAPLTSEEEMDDALPF
jgi:hypothetical protein